MQNKTILITGGSSGIGLQTAKILAKKGATIYIVGRNAEKTIQAVEETKTDSGNNQVDFFIADLSSQKQIRKLAEEIKAKLGRLDVLINNAGGVSQTLQFTEDNIELTFATNHLSYFLLTNLLLDLLKRSAPARIVCVSSNSHYPGRIDFNDLNMTNKYWGMAAYECSKVCNVLFTMELAERLKGSGITVNALHPGKVKTAIGLKNTGFLYKIVWKLATTFLAISVEKGAETSIYLASSKEVENITGKYFSDCKEKIPSAYSQTPRLKEKLWEVSERLTSLSMAKYQL